MSNTQAAWPEGVIARYFTLAAEVLGDLSITVDVTNSEGISGDTATATCTACGTFYKNSRCYTASTVLPWAQEHAEKCRAMPRPGGAR